jgi:DNA-binding CsgD family transcriptional regulator
MMSPLRNFYHKYGQLALYGLSLALLLLVLKWMQWRYLILAHSMDVYIGLIALFFTLLGIWVARQLSRPKVETIVVEKEVPIAAPAAFTLDGAALQALELSKRELEVLTLMSQGLSNAEIAERLFISLSTVKAHASSLFVKLDVKSRTQAMEKARRLRIVP